MLSGNSDSIKEKLSSKNSVYLMSPSRDGCTVTVTLEGPVEVSKLGDREISDVPMDIPKLDDMGKHTVDLSIIAPRFFVGSHNNTCDHMSFFFSCFFNTHRNSSDE